MLKKLMLASALVASSAFAQQNTDISGANFQSGKADAALASLGRKAAASGSKLVITAPPEWHAKIAAKVHAGGDAALVLRDGFYETVLVRVEEKSAVSADAEPAKPSKTDVEKSKAQAEKAKADAEKSKAEAEIAKAEAEKSKAEAEKAKAEAEVAQAHLAQQAAAVRAQSVKAAPAPVAATPVRAPPPTASAGSDVDAIRARLEKTLNEGRSADGTVAVAALQSGDTLYVDGPVKAVTRREGRRLALYWVDGDLDLRRSELKPLAANRYQVISVVRGEATLRREFGQAATVLTAQEPAVDAAGRLALEKSLNEGHPISETIAPAQLRKGDVVYADRNIAVVVRRAGRDLSRYWLVGSLDLTQNGVQADGTNKYKVLNDTLH